jgi:hypothetical protein
MKKEKIEGKVEEKRVFPLHFFVTPDRLTSDEAFREFYYFRIGEVEGVQIRPKSF